MDELAPFLRPYQIGAGVQLALAVVVAVRATAGIPLAGKFRIEQVLSTLLVHHLLGYQQSCQVVHRHVQLLGNLGGREAAYALQHLVTIFRLGSHLANLLVLLLDGLLLNLQSQCQYLHVRQLTTLCIVGRNITTRLANLGQHFRSA